VILKLKENFYKAKFKQVTIQTPFLVKIFYFTTWYILSNNSFL